ncbi:MAG: ADP-ribosylglycohydrolase family protein [Dolichospermum sp.]
MRYSLVNRVKGAFLGAFLGESLAKPNCCNLGKIAVLGTESLISLGKLDVNDWLKRQEQAGIELETNIHSWGQIIFATLPVVMFFHENPVKMRENILEVSKIFTLNQEYQSLITDASLIIGYAIAKSLNEKIDPLNLISEIVNFLDQTSSSLPQQLIKVNDLLKKGVGLETARKELHSPETLINNIGLSFYCFLSTPEDFSLTVFRATKNHDFTHQYITGAIAGVLSGAYNSIVGIPVSWQISSPCTHPSPWGLDNFSQMLQLADTMMAVWSGVYSLGSDLGELTKKGHTIFAAPQIIRRRKNERITT